MCGTDCFLMLLSVLFPPIGVWVKRGICSADSLINLALCCLGFLPGLLHAWYIILKYPDTYDYDRIHDGERQADGSVTYYYIARGGPPPGQQSMNYGTVGVAGSQPSGGQFPGQQSGVANQHPAAPKANAQKKVGAQAAAEQRHQDAGPAQGGGEGGSAQPHGPPPTYADVIKGDHKVQDH